MSNLPETCLHHTGESLLHPQFDEAIAYAESKGIPTTLSFNPLVLTVDKAERLFRAKPSHLLLPVDGFDDISFEQIRGVSNGYDRTIKNTLMAIETREKYSPNTDLKVTIIDIPIYYDQISKVCEWWRTTYGINIYRKPFSNWNGQDQDINALADVSDTILSETDENYNVNGVCATPWSDMSICWDGTVVLCCKDYNATAVLGNVQEMSLNEIWNGEKIRTLRMDLRSGYVENKLCKSCSRTQHCADELFQVSNKTMVKDLLCIDNENRELHNSIEILNRENTELHKQIDELKESVRLSNILHRFIMAPFKLFKKEKGKCHLS